MMGMMVPQFHCPLLFPTPGCSRLQLWPQCGDKHIDLPHHREADNLSYRVLHAFILQMRQNTTTIMG